MQAWLNRRRSALRVLLAFWFVAVVAGSLASQDSLSSMEEVLPFLGWSDLLLHFGAYFGLAALCVLSFERRRGFLLALSMILIGAILEYGQDFSPGRAPDFTDEIANVLGVVSGMVFGGLIRRVAETKGVPNEPEPRASASTA